MKSFPVDIYSIKKYGIEKWYNNFCWPVKIVEYQKLCDDIDRMFESIIIDSPKEIKDALIVLYGTFTVGISLLLHHKLVHTRFKKKGVSITYEVDKTIQPTKNLLSSTEYWKFIDRNLPISDLVRKPIPRDISWKSRVAGRFRAFQNNLNENGISFILYDFFRLNNAYYIIESPDRFMIEFSERNNKLIKKLPRSAFLPSNISSKIIKQDTVNTINRYLCGLKNILQSYGIELSSNNLSEIEHVLQSDLQFIINLNNYIVNKLKTMPKSCFLFKRTGDILLRSIGVSAARSGHKAIGFSHGNYFGTSNDRRVATIMLGTIDNFVLPSIGSEALFKVAKHKFISTLGRKLDFIRPLDFVTQPNLNNLQNEISKPRIIRKVMIIEDGLSPHFQPWPFYLEFNLRKAKFLRNNTNIEELILKKHPDRLRESDNVYDVYYDKMISAPFEEVYDEADAYIFPHIGTTAFGFAMSTNKPIIIFKHILLLLWPSVRKSISKRCRVIPSWYNDRGQIIFDENKLARAILSPPEYPNKEYIQKYLV